MDMNFVPDNTIRQAVSSGFVQLSIVWSQMQTILVNTEVYDAELSLQLTEAWATFEAVGEKLLRDSLYKQGLTDAEIDAKAAVIRKMLGNND